MTSQNWLLPFDEDANKLVRKVVSNDEPIDSASLWRIGHYDIPLTAAQSVSKRFRSRTNDLPDDFRSLRVGLICTDTLTFLDDAMIAVGLRHGLAIMAQSVMLSTALPMIMRGQNPLNDPSFDFVIVLSSLDRISSQLGPGTKVDEVVSGLYEEVKLVAEWAVDTLKAVPVLGLSAPGMAEMHNSADILLSWSESSIRRKLNDELTQLAMATAWPVWNVDRLSAEIGLEHWRNDKQYFWAKLPFDLQHVMRVADSLGRLLAAACGKTRRVLVLDLDNTIWGGVVGDDGVAGLVVGEGGAAAEAYLAVQQLALNLKKRGVVLAVCSKNDKSIALRPFLELPDMVLKEHDIAIFQANWEDKATNIKAIADALSLTTSSLAFLDDNPAERARVRQMLPEVAVIELGEDPADFARRTMSSGYFEHLMLTEEDIKRADYYMKSATKVENFSMLGSYDDYLMSLEMVLNVRRFDESGRQRIAQLINKSNQYNLTTRRYSIQDIADIEISPSRLGLQFRLTDRFGDNGMISVVIVDTVNSTAWEIDTWLMSCRVLKRGVEYAALNVLAELARNAGVQQLIGCYVATSKNSMVADHYPSLGFNRIGRDLPGIWWSLDVVEKVRHAPPIDLDICL